MKIVYASWFSRIMLRSGRLQTSFWDGTGRRSRSRRTGQRWRLRRTGRRRIRNCRCSAIGLIQIIFGMDRSRIIWDLASNSLKPCGFLCEHAGYVNWISISLAFFNSFLKKRKYLSTLFLKLKLVWYYIDIYLEIIFNITIFFFFKKYRNYLIMIFLVRGLKETTIWIVVYKAFLFVLH